MDKMHGACMKCGTVLFDGNQLQQHDPKREETTAAPCTSMFLQDPPHALMESSNDSSSTVTEGKLRCLKCKSKLGQWNWAGSRCSCGCWVTPAFQFNLSKIDYKKQFVPSADDNL